LTEAVAFPPHRFSTSTASSRGCCQSRQSRARTNAKGLKAGAKSQLTAVSWFLPWYNNQLLLLPPLSSYKAAPLPVKLGLRSCVKIQFAHYKKPASPAPLWQRNFQLPRPPLPESFGGATL